MGTRTPATTDRRVLRTQRTLRQALIALILERGWEETSVQDICQRADVGRSTFYTHFADKEELLVSGFEDLRQALRAPVAPAASRPRVLGFARGMIEHAHEQQRLFRAIVGKRSGHVVQKHFRALLIQLVTEDLAGLPLPRPRMEATVHYVAGAFLELLTWWLDARGTGLGPEELEALFHRLTAPVLAAARG